jgi:hypothetical protein
MATKAQLAKAAADLKKAQANLAKAQAATAKKPTPAFTATSTAPSRLAAAEGGALGAVSIESQRKRDAAVIDPISGAPISGAVVGFTPPFPMPEPKVEPGQSGFVGPVAIPSSGGGVVTKVVSGSEKYAGLVALLSSYGIDKIADMVDKVIADFPEADGDEILNLLRYDARYNAPYLLRFSGNATRLKNKMPLLDEATYLQQEMGYEKMFKSYGLKTFANTNQYAKLIGAAVSIDEATARVSLAYDRVLKADPSTLNSFRKFFPMLGNQDLVAAMLDPDEQLPALERKVQSAEIGGAALRQGLSSELMDTTTTSSMYRNVQAGTIGAGNLETAGVSPAAAITRYQTIAAELPTMEKLSSIYGSTLDQYGQREAEQDKILGLASAKRKQDALIAREEAQFQGTSGTMQGSQNRTSQGQF